MAQAGNIDLYAQPKVTNPDGSVSTVDSISIGTDGGKEILIPRVTPDGRHLSSQDAIAEFKKTGRHLGIFDSIAEADQYAEQLHNDYAAGKYDKRTTMPQQRLTYAVKFPDGFTQEFSGPPDMSDADAYQRAVQERSVKEGRIKTTFAGGAAKALGEDPTTTGALIGGAGMLTGLAPLVAAAPLAAKGIEYATKSVTGQHPETPSLPEVGMLGAEGLAAGYGPQMLSNAAGGIAEATSRLKGSGVVPWAIREAGQMSKDIRPGLQAITPQSVSSTVGEMVSGQTPATRQAIQALQAKLSDPRLANNPQARAAVQQALLRLMK